MHVSNRNEELRQMQRATSQKKQRKKKGSESICHTDRSLVRCDDQ